MGASKSKPSKTRYTKCYLNSKRTAHCCLEQCFHPIEETTQLQHVMNPSWYFTKKHEKHLRQCLSQYKLEVIADVIMDYLENYKFAAEFVRNGNYRSFIRTSLSLLSDTPQNRQVCKIWYDAVLSKDPSGWYGTGPAIKFVMLGTGAVGKSALTVRFCQDRFSEEYDPTLEDSWTRRFPLDVDRQDMDKYLNHSSLASSYADRQQITVDILDTAGREEFSATIDMWFREGQVLLLVFDVMYQGSFDEIQVLYERILRAKQPEWTEKHDETDFGIVCVGNKCDLREDPKYTQPSWRTVGPVDMEKAMKWFEEKQLPYIETSAKTGKNVNFLFRHAVYEYWIQSHSGCVRY